MEKKTGQKNVGEKNKDWVSKFFIFLSHIFLSGLPSRSDSFKVPLAFPIGHGGIEGRLFGSEEMRVMLDNVFAERAAGEFARGKSVRGFGQRVGHTREIFRGVNVTDEAFGRLDLVGDPVQSRSQSGGERQIRVAIGAGNSAFDAQ